MRSLKNLTAVGLAFALSLTLGACGQAQQEAPATEEPETQAQEAQQEEEAPQQQEAAQPTGQVLELTCGTLNDTNDTYTNDDLSFTYTLPAGFAFADQDVLSTYNKSSEGAGTLSTDGKTVTIEPAAHYTDMYAASVDDNRLNINLTVINITHTSVDVSSQDFIDTMKESWDEDLKAEGITDFDITAPTVTLGDLVCPSIKVAFKDGDTERYMQRVYYTVGDQLLVNLTASANDETTLMNILGI